MNRFLIEIIQIQIHILGPESRFFLVLHFATLWRDSFLLIGCDSLHVVLVEGSDRAETLARADVALGPAHAALFQVALDHVSVVHGKARVVSSCSHGRV